MIEALQKTAAVQAERLNVLSQWQKAYTDELNQIHSFVAKNGDAIDNPDADSAAAKARQDLNTANTTYTQQGQGNRQVVSDDAKALQSNVNQTNDAVNSQSDMATSILQQLSTILTSIYSSG
jgi:cob(I)alamin adenosyltransferase